MFVVVVGDDREQNLSVLLLRSRSALLLRSRSALLPGSRSGYLNIKKNIYIKLYSSEAQSLIELSMA